MRRPLLTRWLPVSLMTHPTVCNIRASLIRGAGSKGDAGSLPRRVELPIRIRYPYLESGISEADRPARVEEGVEMRIHLRREAGVPILLVGVLLLLSGCTGGDGSRAAAPKQPPAVPVTAALAVQRDVPVQLGAIGTAEAFSTVTVKTLVDGQIVKVGFREGQDVRKGDLIFVIDPRPHEAALKTAEANLAKSIALKESAEKDVRRYVHLVENDLVPKQQYDQAVSNAAALAATVSADNAAVENARVRLGYCFIRSPIGGRTGALDIKEGNIVKANDASLVTIHQVAPIYVTFAVPEQHLSDIRRYRDAGTLVVTATIPGQENAPARGTLAFISNTVDN